MTTRHFAAGILIINNKKQILFMLRDNDPKILDPGLWGIIGGGIEPGESPLEAVIREIQEETGLKLEPNQIEEFMFIRTPRKDAHIFLTRGNWSDSDIVKGEGEKMLFVDPEEMENLPLTDYLRYILSVYKRNRA